VPGKTLIRRAIIILFLCGTISCKQQDKISEDDFITYIADPKRQDIHLYWKDEHQQIFRSLQNLKTWLEGRGQTLLFAMNGGMYRPGNIPQGLYIENQKTIIPLDTSRGNGNFYLQPNGVFYLTMDNVPFICTTTEFVNDGRVKFATQSGPMLLTNGKMHPAFQTGSANLNIRNGVGLLHSNQMVFVMSKKKISFYEFAAYFKSLHCQNALYLDGLVSRTYLPQKGWTQMDGDFGVIIGVTKPSDK